MRKQDIRLSHSSQVRKLFDHGETGLAAAQTPESIIAYIDLKLSSRVYLTITQGTTHFRLGNEDGLSALLLCTEVAKEVLRVVEIGALNAHAFSLGYVEDG